MRMLLSCLDRKPAFVGTLGIMLFLVVGCASKNPLMDDTPASSQTASAPPGMQVIKPTGAKRFFGIFKPYRIDIQQGNFASQEMITQLRESMDRPEGVTREQVRFVLGTPLLTDIFHADRWDYVFLLKKGNGEQLSSKVAVFFDNNRLVRIEGDNLPTEAAYLELIAGNKKQ